MVWLTILCVLAAFGLAMLVWIFFGARLLPLQPKEGSVSLFWRAEGDETAFFKTYEALVWLRESGLAPPVLEIRNDGLTPEAHRAAERIADSDPQITLTEGAAAPERLTDGANDPAGHGQHDRLSE